MTSSTRSGKAGVRPADAGTRAGKSRTGRADAGGRKAQAARTGRSGTGKSAAKSTRASGTRAKQGKKKTAGSDRYRETLVSQNRLSMFLAVFVVVVLLIVVAVNAVSLTRKLHENRARANLLRQEIRTEEQRAADIEDYRRYTQTDEYIEEIAREKLGLIYEGETVFKEEQ